jgi:hypothetical protein
VRDSRSDLPPRGLRSAALGRLALAGAAGVGLVAAVTADLSGLPPPFGSLLKGLLLVALAGWGAWVALIAQRVAGASARGAAGASDRRDAHHASAVLEALGRATRTCCGRRTLTGGSST